MASRSALDARCFNSDALAVRAEGHAGEAEEVPLEGEGFLTDLGVPDFGFDQQRFPPIVKSAAGADDPLAVGLPGCVRWRPLLETA